MRGEHARLVKQQKGEEQQNQAPWHPDSTLRSEAFLTEIQESFQWGLRWEFACVLLLLDKKTIPDP